MNNKAKASLSPNLRFLEFLGTGSWQLQPLGSIAVFFKGKGLPKSALTPIGKTACIHYGELFTEYQEVIGAVKSRTNLDENVFLSVGNDVLMPTSDVTPSGLAKACCVKDDDIILGGDILVIRSDRDACNGEFLARQIRHLESRVLQLVSGSTVFHLYASSMEKLVLSFPCKQEQQKIADCLSSLDELISAQARKVDALKIHKKGLMQQLFPREGETQPRLRFPEFREEGDWEVEPLNQLADYENGKAYEKDITEGGKYIVVNSRFISTDGSVQKYTNADYLIAKRGEVLMVLSDLPKGRALAKCFFVDANDRYAVNQRVCRLKPTRIDGKFLYYILNRHPRLLAFDDGLNQTHLSKSSVTECLLYVPPTSDEQRRIADGLTSLDTHITTATQELETLKAHKRGLMQQLFPCREEDV